MNPFQLKNCTDEGYLEIVCLRSPTLPEVLSLLKQMSEDATYQRRLWDLGDIELELSFHELISASDFGRSFLKMQNRAAIVASHATTHGIMKQYTLFRDQQGLTELEVFWNKADAKSWLLS